VGVYLTHNPDTSYSHRHQWIPKTRQISSFLHFLSQLSGKHLNPPHELCWYHNSNQNETERNVKVERLYQDHNGKYFSEKDQAFFFVFFSTPHFVHKHEMKIFSSVFLFLCLDENINYAKISSVESYKF
jgi:hypothetical protein